MNTKKLALTSVMISLAIVLSYVEKLIPAFVAVPGVKIGLANIAVVFTLYKMGTKDAFVVSLLRVVIANLLFGSILSLLYSLAGALVSLIVMAVLKKTSLFSTVGVSIAGGVIHNMAQLVVACFFVGSDILKYYSPVLLLTGIVSGAVIGLIAAVLIKRIEID